MVIPTGEWYFTGPLPEDHEDSSYTNYREHADPTTFGPFIAALSKAVQNMPVLDHFMLTSELGNEKGYFNISYYAPGLISDGRDQDEGDVGFRRIYYEVGQVWRPDDEVSGRLREVGRERFLDDWYSGGLY